MRPAEAVDALTKIRIETIRTDNGPLTVTADPRLQWNHDRRKPMTNELLDAVDDLTLPKPVKIPTDDGYTWAREDALLVQLQEAIISSIGGTAGGRTSPWTRNVLDSAALHQATIITSTIGDWCRMVDIKPTRDAVTDLRAWYVAMLATPDRDDQFYIRQMTVWAHQIRDMINPPKTVEITATCPACGQGQWTNDLGERIANPLLLTYRPETGSIWQDAKATCRACSTLWEGEWRLRELRHDVDAREAG